MFEFHHIGLNKPVEDYPVMMEEYVVYRVNMMPIKNILLLVQLKRETE
jgi:hypothetical protein